MSRGLCLHDLYEVKPKETSGPRLPKFIRYAIKVGGLYYTEHAYPWSPDVRKARLWTDITALELIIHHWNTKATRKSLDTIIGGVVVTDTAKIVDVSDLLLPVTDLWEHFTS
jgi:hypothetical protein